MSDQVQQIKDILNIVDIVGQYVKLTKAGKNYKGLSPFGNEKTPSFFVSPDKGMYYDFSSSQGGDIFSFIEKMEGVDFKGALQILADRAGIELKKESKQSKDTRERLYSILEETTCFFETKLSENKQAIKYLKGRGVEESTMRSFRIGFALDDWQALYDHLKKVGYKENEIEKAGLIKKGESGKYYDRFRSRILFPIMDSAGRVVAFSGRIFGEAAKDDKNAKYLNSPETQLFDKSRILYGYNKAKQFIRKYDFSILVEGQMDLVMSHQAGYGNTVAVSGTGLTDEHLLLLDRLSKKLVMAFDADPAGVASSGRAASLALRRGMDVKVAKVPIGKDPADCIYEDVGTWKEAIRDSRHIIDFYMDTVMSESKEKGWDDRKLTLQARDTVFPYIAAVTSATDKAHFVRTIANILGIAEEAVWTDVKAIKTEPARTSTQENNSTHSIKKEFSRKDDLEKALAGLLYWQDETENSEITEEVLKEAAKVMRIHIDEILAKYSDEKESLILQAEVTYLPPQNPLIIMNDLMKEIAKIQVSNELSKVSRQQKEAERSNNTNESQKLEKRVKELSQFKESLV